MNNNQLNEIGSPTKQRSRMKSTNSEVKPKSVVNSS